MSANEKFNLKLEKYLLGELTEIEKSEIEKDPDFKIKIQELENSNKEFFNKFDINKLAKETERRVNKKNIVSFPTKAVTTLAAAAACFILAINIIPNLNLDTTEKEIIYLKGSERINIYLNENNNIIELNDLNNVKEGDQLQITYFSTSMYGIIFSVDGLNNITYHFPESINSSVAVQVGKEVNLPSSYTLDNAPHFEKFYLITSKDSFDFNFVNREIEKIEVTNGTITNDIKLPKKYNVESITLIKE